MAGLQEKLKKLSMKPGVWSTGSKRKDPRGLNALLARATGSSSQVGSPAATAVGPQLDRFG